MSESATTTNGVTAVVAAYLPDESLVGNVERIAAQVDHVVVVDDGSGIAAKHVLDSVRSIDPGSVQVVLLEANLGIAAALNRGIRTALRSGAAFVLTMDQDSRIEDGYVDAALVAAHRLAASGRPFAAIAAGVQSGHVVRPVLYGDRGDAVTPTIDAIQSGMLIPAGTFRTVGTFDESLFIDCVDTDFVLRAAGRRLPTYLARACALDHPLGRLIETPGIRATRSGRQSFAFHPPWRRYYISRNRAIVLGRFGPKELRWAAESTAGEAVQLLRCLMYGPEKIRQSFAVVLGITDAILGRRGRLHGARAALLGGAR